MMHIHQRYKHGNAKTSERATLKAENDAEAQFLSILCEAILNGEPVEFPVADKVFFVEGRYYTSKSEAKEEAEDRLRAEA